MSKNTGPPPGFAMVPGWLIWQQPEANELLVYSHLALFGTFNTGYQVYEECRPSKQTLADGGEMRVRDCTGGDDCDKRCGAYHGTGLSVSTVYRALRGLVSKGVAVGEERWDPDTGAQLPTVYRLTYNNPAIQVSQRVNPHAVDRPDEPADTGPPVTHDRGGSTAGDRDPLSPMTDNPEPLTHNQRTQKRSKTPTSGTVGAERTVRNARGRTNAAPPRAKEPSQSRSGRQSQVSPAALALLAQLPRPWRECEPWVRQRLAGKLDKALGQYGPAAILWAFQTHGRDPAKVLSAEGRPAGDGETRHLTAMDRVLTLFRKDVQGGACRDCALEHPGRPCGDPLLTLVPGLCIVCDSPDATVRPELPLKSFACDPCWADMADGTPAGEAA